MSRSNLTSVEYAELAGLQIALANLETPPKPDTQYIMDWMRGRIQELETKRNLEERWHAICHSRSSY